MTELSRPCPACQRPLLVRINRKTGTEFWGCSGYPEFCDHTEPLTEYQRLLAQGDGLLPGFE